MEQLDFKLWWIPTLYIYSLGKSFIIVFRDKQRREQDLFVVHLYLKWSVLLNYRISQVQMKISVPMGSRLCCKHMVIFSVFNINALKHQAFSMAIMLTRFGWRFIQYIGGTRPKKLKYNFIISFKSKIHKEYYGIHRTGIPSLINRSPFSICFIYVDDDFIL